MKYFGVASDGKKKMSGKSSTLGRNADTQHTVSSILSHTRKYQKYIEGDS